MIAVPAIVAVSIWVVAFIGGGIAGAKLFRWWWDR